MVVYFNSKSMSYFRTDEEQHITVHLTNGDSLDISFSSRMDFLNALGKFERMIKEYETYNYIVRYNTDTGKLYF